MSKNINIIKSLNQFSNAIHPDLTEEEVLWQITKDIIKRLGFVDCVIYKYDAEKRMLVQKAAFGSKNPDAEIIYNRLEIKMGEGIVGSVAQNRTPEIIQDTSKDSRYLVDDENRLSEICVPILINDELYGVIDSEHPKKYFFNELHLELLTLIASLCAQKIIKIRNSQKVKITEDNKNYKALQALMTSKKIYKRPGLSLEQVAKMLKISPGYLSKVVNDVTENSFAEYVNAFRVEEIKRNLRSPQYKHYTILSIGLEAGFNSKASFLRNFKNIVGVPPSEYQDFGEEE